MRQRLLLLFVGMALLLVGVAGQRRPRGFGGLPPLRTHSMSTRAFKTPADIAQAAAEAALEAAVDVLLDEQPVGGWGPGAYLTRFWREAGTMGALVAAGAQAVRAGDGEAVLAALTEAAVSWRHR